MDNAEFTIAPKTFRQRDDCYTLLEWANRAYSMQIMYMRSCNTALELANASRISNEKRKAMYYLNEANRRRHAALAEYNKRMDLAPCRLLVRKRKEVVVKCLTLDNA